ncbi:Molybdopterin synthase catalytic subunit MoaE (MoaE) (PDB:1FM0) (PUBMED:32239579) [Commensalibacter communis]|uniref:Molybdopterin synthase catalytic subunit n=1 Tax=Commensalibacter communis TaxID=2972786 RepID=A0A9W4TNY6_9PROT|nr:molybdenum cofactor biosynthesis protein MoaE [Commensalibacter communis]CAI3936111.1 Molybdopterin synthase catalytic subunit MoaE (MoaE) (PDB:1FM0) (PUBMED:32239579) [Commensalibacter communis]CAI3938038.1 Molybdopterin synthase catalytic subunit MoaE (MoaE) (PDB:1FM0) (PUBMED:32239579) [Commensalibacter communis]CAI3942101.1 Molybdopterin synthase catalytic subunit MoaE (MoaE) (PDB:1FM0) (PUBMED:32239579) [Commensalibacter communis]CAI3942304.1 Molybdopterin synthase catalytic subunit Moa
MFWVKIQEAPFDAELPNLDQKIQENNCGALVSFKGIVRGYDEKDPLDYLYLEHFPEVTEQEIERILQRAQGHWGIRSAIVIHRVGRLNIGENIVLVMVSASHRKAAFEASQFIMDYLKTEAPFWKKEFFQNGNSRWVEAKQSDIEQKKRWALS